MTYTSPEFWVAIALLLLIAIAWRPASGAVTRWLDGEREKIRADLAEAHKLRADAEILLEHSQKKHREVMSHAETLLLHAREEAYRLRRQSADDLTKALAVREKQGLERIAQMEAAVVADLKRLAVNASIDVVEQLLAEKVDAKKAAQFADQSIADLVRKAAA